MTADWLILPVEQSYGETRDDVEAALERVSCALDDLDGAVGDLPAELRNDLEGVAERLRDELEEAGRALALLPEADEDGEEKEGDEDEESVEPDNDHDDD